MIGHRAAADQRQPRRRRTSPQWVETHYAPLTVDGVIIYDLTGRARNS